MVMYIFLQVPDWKGNHQYDYYAWRLDTEILPVYGCKNMNWKSRYPFPYTCATQAPNRDGTHIFLRAPCSLHVSTFLCGPDKPSVSPKHRVPNICYRKGWGNYALLQMSILGLWALVFLRHVELFGANLLLCCLLYLCPLFFFPVHVQTCFCACMYVSTCVCIHVYPCVCCDGIYVCLL